MPPRVAPGPHVALIRGINVGRAKRVAMADLRRLVADLGYHDVRTLLNSGNVLFTVGASSRGEPAVRIERALGSELGVSARVTVLSAPELQAVVDGNPLVVAERDPSRLLVSVLTDPADRARLLPLMRRRWAPEAVAVGERVCYLWCPGGILASPLGQAVGRLLGDATTARNWATISKLHALVRAER